MKVLITRKLRDKTAFLQHLPKNAEVSEQSFIEIQSIPFEIPTPIDWIFFSSKSAVSSFLKQHSIPSDIKLGAVSEATAEFLQENNLHCNFIGASNKSTEENAIEFSKMSSGKVFFPSSDRSLQTFPKALNEERAIVKTIYLTKLLPFKMDEVFNYYLFTSPSNVDGYLKKNKFQKNCKVIAIGQSTAKRIKELNKSINLHVSDESSEIGLAKKVSEIYLKN